MNIIINNTTLTRCTSIYFWDCRSWIYNYLCNQWLCLTPLTLSVRIPLRRYVLDTTLCDEVCQWLAEGRWFSQSTPVSSTNKTENDRHDKTEILLKLALNTITQNLQSFDGYLYWVSEWLSFNAKWTILQLYHGEHNLYFAQLMMMMFALYKTIMLSWIFFIVLAHWNKIVWLMARTFVW